MVALKLLLVLGLALGVGVFIRLFLELIAMKLWEDDFDE